MLLWHTISYRIAYSFDVMKIALYSSLFGDYDNFIEPKYVHEQDNYDYFLFTDRDIVSTVYNVIDCDIINDDPILTARTYKIYEGYRILCEEGYDVIIYYDSNIIPRASIDALYKKQVTGLMLMKHPIRDCIYDEFHACLDGRRDNRDTMLNQVQAYADDYYPKGNGLVATGVMIRRNNKQVLKFCRAWLDEVEKWSIRDQLSFNYVAWKMKFKFDMINFGDTLTYYFKYVKHKNKFIHKPK